MNLFATIRRRRPTPFELAAVTPHHVRESRPDWMNGLLMLLGAVLALGWIDANDNAVYLREQEQLALKAADQWKERAIVKETTAAVRLVEGSEGFHCQIYNIQREWDSVVADECRRLAGILRTARATR